MAVTIKQISAVSGVSRGTVDRVLNNRGNVKPETEKLVRRIAEELGYRPNSAGQALAARKKNYKIGIILISEGNEFFEDVIAGIHQAEDEISGYGIQVILKTMKGYTVGKQLELMKELAAQVQLLIINAINDRMIADEITELDKKSIPVITINTETEHSSCICHVGSDFIRSGETACGLLGLMTKGSSKVIIATGSVKALGHNQRIIGFNNICKIKYPKITVMDIIETEDDDVQAFVEMQKILKKYKELDAVYIAAAGAYGICKALSEAGRQDKITVIANDDTPVIRSLVESGAIKATICQQPRIQGYRSVMLASQYLLYGILPENRRIIVENEIKIMENLSSERS